MSQIAICIITNKINDKSFVFKSKDSAKRWNRFKKLLNNHSFYNMKLQEDWDNYSSDSFIFEVKELVDEDVIDDIFINYINSFNNSYNQIDYDKFFNKSLKSTIEKLRGLLNEKTSDSNFKIILNELKLDESDALNFKQEFLLKIEVGEINYNNFDKEYDALLNRYSKRKEEKLENELKLSLLAYLDELNNSNLNKINLNDSDLEVIKSKIKLLINNKQLISKNDVLNKFNILAKEKNDVNIYREKCYKVLNNLFESYDFKNKVKSNDISEYDCIEIKNSINNLIDDEKITINEIESYTYDLLRQKVLEKQKHDENLKKELKDNLYDIIGNENLNVVFVNRLTRAYLHKNVAYEILLKMIRLIDDGKIKSTVELKAAINKEIKNKEKDDIIDRLNILPSNEIRSLLKKNKLHVLSLNKSSKIDKLINSVSPNVLRTDIRNLGYPLDIKEVKNPYILYCQNCGAQIYIDDKFCHKCGIKL